MVLHKDNQCSFNVFKKYFAIITNALLSVRLHLISVDINNSMFLPYNITYTQTCQENHWQNFCRTIHSPILGITLGNVLNYIKSRIL
jgi:hypothetical protein